MACQIKRKEDGTISEVLAPNGKPSILYRDLVTEMPNIRQDVLQDEYVKQIVDSEYVQDSTDQEVALAAWSKAYTADFIEQFGDWKQEKLSNTDSNGEPFLNELYKTVTSSGRILRQVNQEYLGNVLKLLEAKFGLKYKLINNPSSSKGYVDYVSGPTPFIVVNVANATHDTPIHEYAHVFLSAIKNQNKRLFSSLVHEVLKTKEGLNTLQSVALKYPELTEEGQVEESIVQLLGEYAADKLDKNTGIYNAIKKIWDTIVDFLQKAFNVEITDLKANMSMKELSLLLIHPNIKFELDTSYIKKRILSKEDFDFLNETTSVESYDVFAADRIFNSSDVTMIPTDSNDVAIIPSKDVAKVEQIKNKLSSVMKYTYKDVYEIASKIKQQIESYINQGMDDDDILSNFIKIVNEHPVVNEHFEIMTGKKIEKEPYIFNSILFSILNQSNQAKGELIDMLTVDYSKCTSFGKELLYIRPNIPISEFKPENTATYIYKYVPKSVTSLGLTNSYYYHNSQTSKKLTLEDYKKIHNLSSQVLSNLGNTARGIKSKKFILGSDTYTVSGHLDNKNIEVSFWSEKFGMTDVDENLFFKVLPRVIDTISEMFYDSEYNTISFTPVESSEGKRKDSDELRRKGYNIFLKRLFGKYSLVGRDENKLVIPIPDMFKNQMFFENVFQKIPSTVKPGVVELFEQNPELANIGTQEQYSQYLDQVFPDSKVKDIMYHGGNTVDILKPNSLGLIYFAENIEYANVYSRRAQESSSLIKEYYTLYLDLKKAIAGFTDENSITSDTIELEQAAEYLAKYTTNTVEQSVKLIVEKFKYNNLQDLTIDPEFGMIDDSGDMDTGYAEQAEEEAYYRSLSEQEKKKFDEDTARYKEQRKQDVTYRFFNILEGLKAYQEEQDESEYVKQLSKVYSQYEGVQLEGKVYNVILDVKNPQYTNEDVSNESITQGKIVLDKSKDSLIGKDGLFHKTVEGKKVSIEGENVVAVKNSSQVHILGSKQDIAGFKQFVSNPLPTSTKWTEIKNNCSKLL